jgi:hypothetical protein
MEYIFLISVIIILGVYIRFSRKKMEIELQRLAILREESLARQKILLDFLDPQPKTPKNRGSLTVIKPNTEE